jgi:hypothetical protein
VKLELEERSLSGSQMMGPIGVGVGMGAKPRSSLFGGAVGEAYMTPVNINNEVNERTNSNFKELTHRKEG